MGSRIKPSEQVMVEAERWFARLLATSCTQAERDACRHWQEEDPEHAEAYARVEHASAKAAELSSQPRYRAAARRIREEAARSASRRSRVRWTLSLSAMAGMVFAVGIGWRAWDPAQPEQLFATSVGEQRALTLEDGSRVLLDTDSAVAVSYSRKRRNIVLRNGRADFSVAPAPDRPFIVQVKNGAVRAIGTRFQVREEPKGAQVSLLEGRVEVTAVSGQGERRATTLVAGEQLAFDSGELWAKGGIDLEAAEGWPRGELVFRERLLSDLVAEMNRYTKKKLRIGDAALNELRFSGVFFGNDQESLIQALGQVWAVRAEQVSPDEIVLRAKR